MNIKEQIKEYLENKDENIRSIGLELLFGSGFTGTEVATEFWAINEKAYRQNHDTFYERWQKEFKDIDHRQEWFRMQQEGII